MPRPVHSTLAGLSVGGLPVQVRRSERRTVSLKVTPQGLTVYAPRRAEDARLRQFVEDKRAWAERHLLTFQERVHQPAALLDGLVLPFAGEQLTLRALPGLKRAQRDGDELHAPAERLSAAVEAWYRARALEVFGPLVKHFADQLKRGRPLTGVKVTTARRRWGSCTSAGVVRLHWRLLLAPPDILQYVAAHEAAHLAELNHSPRYWQQLAQLVPDHRAAERWLKDNGWALMQAWDLKR